MADEQALTVTRADFDSVSRKFNAFVQALPPGEQAVMEGVMQLAGQILPWWGPIGGLHYRYHPRGAKHLVFGGADGLTVLFGRSGFIVVHPEGPLPTDFTQFIGASLVMGEAHGAGV